MSRFIEYFKAQARALKRETRDLYLAGRDPRTPWHAKVVIALVVAYALSPIDLIPDFIPVLGYLDDVLLLPLGIYLALKLIPAAVLADARRAAHQASFNLSASRAAAVVIILLWMISMTVGGVLVLRYFDAV
ncbi:MAG TPA: YkvA family protein [Candidatus Deferrimicrobium sp.]|nr:YkvA family protein [Candidatus Deferrimicrobium sp.]